MAKKQDTEQPETPTFAPALVLGLADGSVIRADILDPSPESVMTAARQIASELAIKRTM